FLLLLQSDAATAHRLRRLVLTYGIVWAAAVAALGGISWWLVGRALQPTRKALQQQNEFIAAASHELRSPLTVIKTSLEAAQNSGTESGAESAPGRRFIAIAQSETERMRRLTEDLLLLAGQDANVWHSDLAPLELDTLCIELYEAYRLPAQQRGHTLSLQLPEQRFPTVQGDKQRVNQLFSILLHNAMEYATPGTPIEIVAAVKAAVVTVAITDHGKGIPDENKAAVFERFMRGDKSRTDKAHFGLGLSVAKEIAGMHHAKIAVADTPGGGACFVVAFPHKG
ncbi:MAG: HAMP domain-containing sensor histidine kinase, partial [Gemmiger sp.]|nr:HAMP domain-containing sensor histidine kinase [Gemmiger sp.]